MRRAPAGRRPARRSWQQRLAEGLFRNPDAIVLLLDARGRAVRCNAVFERLTGWSQRAVRGRDWFDTFLPTELRARVRELYAAALAGRMTRGHRNPILDRDGRRHEIEWWSLSVVPLAGGAGGVLACGRPVAASEGLPPAPDWNESVITLAQANERLRAEVDRRCQVEASLERQQRRLRRILDAAPDCVKLVDADGCIVDMNAAGLSLLEAASTAEVQGQSMSGLATEPHRYELRRLHADALAGRRGRLTFEVETLRGRRRWFESHAIPYDEGGGRLVLYVTRDVTERRRDEAQLLALRTAFDGAQVAVALATRDGQLTYVNPAFAGIWGLEAVTDAIGRSATTFWDDPFAATEVMLETLREGLWRGHLHARRADGRLRTLDVAASTYEVAETGERGLLATFADVTEHLAAATALRRSLAEKTALLREVHHRVKNNLQVVCSLLSLEALRQASGEARRGLETTRYRVEAMAMVHEALYRGEELSTVELTHYLSDLVRLLAESHEGWGEVDFAGRDRIDVCPDTAIACGIVVTELVSNACKHAQSPGVRSRVGVEVSREAAAVCLRVHDNGIDRDAAAGDADAPGLGLRLVRTLAVQLDGTLEVTRGGGTRVALRFPLSRERPQAAAR